MMVPVWIALAVALAHGAGDVRLTLRQSVQVDPGDVLLQDIADLRGSDQARVASLARVSLGTGPAPGLVRTIDSSEVRSAICGPSRADCGLELDGAPSVAVRLRARSADKAEIIEALRAYIAESSPWRADEMEIRLPPSIDRFEVPPCAVVFRVLGRPALGHSRTQLLPVAAVVEGKLAAMTWVAAEISVHAKIWVAATRIPYGQILSPRDVIAQVTEIRDLREKYLRAEDEEVAGQALRRALSAGEPLTRDSLTRPDLVHSGDTVHLSVRRGGVRLAALARAEQNGKLGQIIRVRSIDFMHPFKAAVTGPGTVEIFQEK
jgi:flagellar basal body P-ring formation protein FlgA